MEAQIDNTLIDWLIDLLDMRNLTSIYPARIQLGYGMNSLACRCGHYIEFKMAKPMSNDVYLKDIQSRNFKRTYTRFVIRNSRES